MRIREIFETTSAGGIATVSMPLGSVKKRRKEQSIYEVDNEKISFKYKNISSKEEYLERKKALFNIINDPMTDPESLSVAKRYLIKLNAEAEELGYR